MKFTLQYHNDTPFLVRESRGILIFIGVVLLLMAGTMYRYNIHSQSNITDHLDVLLLFTLPGLLFIVASFKQRVVMRIDFNGIYYLGDLITDWPNFKRVYLKEDYLNDASLNKCYYLHIQYFSATQNIVLEDSIKMQNTFNRGEEDIVAAIERICKEVCNREVVN